MSPNIIVRVRVEEDESDERPEDGEEMDGVEGLALEADDRTPEEAGYGHGV